MHPKIHQTRLGQVSARAGAIGSVRYCGLLAILAGVVAGCSVTTPPVVPTLHVDAASSQDSPRFVWYDLFTDDVERASSFYGDLFGWDFESTPQYGNFSLARHDGIPVAGLVRIDEARAEAIPSQWVPNLLVDDLDDAARVFGESGRILKGPVNMPDRGRIAVVEDAEGAPLLLLQTVDGAPGVPDGTNGRFLWTELWSADEATALPFYRAAVGFERVANPPGLDEDYVILGRGDRRLAGVVRIPYDEVSPHWLSYIAVADPVEVAARAEALGGRILIAPTAINNRVAAVIADPNGAVFGVQQWPIEGLEEGQP